MTCPRSACCTKVHDETSDWTAELPAQVHRVSAFMATFDMRYGKLVPDMLVSELVADDCVDAHERVLVKRSTKTNACAPR